MILLNCEGFRLSQNVFPLIAVDMNEPLYLCRSKRQSICVVTALVDGESQSLKEETNYALDRLFRKIYFWVIDPVVQTRMGL